MFDLGIKFNGAKGEYKIEAGINSTASGNLAGVCYRESINMDGQDLQD
jgi:hypothetical protein